MTVSDWPTGKYGAILADPPWHYQTWGKHSGTRHATMHYDTMTIEEIKALPVEDLAADDCVLFLWMVDWMPPLDVHEIIEAWGFTYKTIAFVWAKTTKDGTRYPIGLGQWTRANPESCILATRGTPKRVGRDVRKLLVAPRREHSRKPDEVYSRIERLVPGPYVELFGRQAWAGWDVWGNDTEKFGDDDQERLAF